MVRVREIVPGLQAVSEEIRFERVETNHASGVRTMSETEKTIQARLYWHLQQRGHRWICPNVYAYNWESDLLSITKHERVCEYEIKISQSDFKRDIDKVEKHMALTQGVRYRWGGYLRSSHGDETVPCARPNRFYYACPPGIINAADIPGHAGLIYINDRGVTRVIEAPKLHGGQIDQDRINAIMTSFYYKYWRSRG